MRIKPFIDFSWEMWGLGICADFEIGGGFAIIIGPFQIGIEFVRKTKK